MNDVLLNQLVSVTLSPDYYTAVCAVIVIFVVVSRWALTSFKKEEQLLLFIAVFGFLLSWASQGVWLSIVGIFFTVLAGGAILIRSESPAEDTDAGMHFVRRNLMGVLITSLGACGLVSLDYVMDYSSTLTWATHASSLTLRISAGMILTGLLTIMIPWTAQNVVMKKSRLTSFDHLLFVVALPSLSAFSILLRLYPHFVEINAFQIVSWIVTGVSLLLVFPVYLRNQPEDASDHLFTLIPAMGVCVYCFSGPWPAFIVLFSSVVLAFVISTLRIMGTNGWGKVLAALAIYGWLGGMGYASSGAYLSIGQNLRDDVPLLVGFSFFYFFFSIQAWRVLFSYFYLNSNPRPSGWKWLLPTLWVIVPLGVFLTGTFTGGALAPDLDQIDGLNSHTWSWLSFFDTQIKEWDGDRFAFASAVHWSIFFLSACIAAFTRTPSKDQLANWPEKFSRLKRWAEAGFGFIWLSEKGSWLLEKAGLFLQQTLSEYIWDYALPRALDRTRAGIENIGCWLDRVSSAVTSDRLEVLVRAPSKLIQLTQSGNLQWYFVFGLVGSLLVLIHFIRF